MRQHFERFFSHHRDETSISQNIASLNTEQTSKNIFTYIKMHYGETILAKIRKLGKTMIKYSCYNH